jgi:hypothetical protein
MPFLFVVTRLTYLDIQEQSPGPLGGECHRPSMTTIALATFRVAVIQTKPVL